MHIGSIVIDCYHFDAMQAFWQAALHYELRAPARGGWVVLLDPEGHGPNVSLNQIPEPPVGRNRIHLDLYTPYREAEVQRLLALGATRHPQTYDPADDFRVLADPDGNLFCVVHKDPNGSEGSRAEGGTKTPAEANAVPPHDVRDLVHARGVHPPRPANPPGEPREPSGRGVESQAIPLPPRHPPRELNPEKDMALGGKMPVARSRGRHQRRR